MDAIDIDILIGQFGKAIFKRTEQSSGHIHIHFKGFKDHIILFYSEGKLDEILTKSPNCKKGTYINWKLSEFAGYQPKDALKGLQSEIKKIEIDEIRPITWSSYKELLEWLKSSE